MPDFLRSLHRPLFWIQLDLNSPLPTGYPHGLVQQGTLRHSVAEFPTQAPPSQGWPQTGTGKNVANEDGRWWGVSLLPLIT